MLDQSHNVTDPIESLMRSAMEILPRLCAGADRRSAALAGYQDGNDALMASETLKAGFRTDVEPILAMARLDAKGGAIDPVATYRRLATAPASPPSVPRAAAARAASSETIL
jgi:L-rhamnose isomerase/sugar isomerase